MVSLELIGECLDILDFKYTPLSEDSVELCFFDTSLFPHEIYVRINVENEGTLITVVTNAPDFKPEGNLLELANRHNCRRHTPACYIDPEDNEVMMHSAYVVREDVSPHYILENVLRIAIFTSLEAFATFELSDSELEARQNNE